VYQVLVVHYGDSIFKWVECHPSGSVVNALPDRSPAWYFFQLLRNSTIFAMQKSGLKQSSLKTLEKVPSLKARPK
jgi:hypothetical protein